VREGEREREERARERARERESERERGRGGGGGLCYVFMKRLTEDKVWKCEKNEEMCVMTCYGNVGKQMLFYILYEDMCVMRIYVCVCMCILYGETDRRRGVEKCKFVCARVGFGVGGGRWRRGDVVERARARRRKKMIDGDRQKIEVENEESSFDCGNT
jgi:hypothetical protein